MIVRRISRATKQQLGYYIKTCQNSSLLLKFDVIITKMDLQGSSGLVLKKVRRLDHNL